MAALESLVLFESGAANARGSQALQFGFEREGIKVHSCLSANALIALCIKESPQLALISLPEGEKAISETLAALDELRATESIARLPLLVLGERDLRDEVLRAGADEFVPRPAYLRDVLNLCRLVVGFRERDDKEVRGLVEEYGLFFLLRALSIVGRSAVLELERAGRYAEIHIVAGEVAMARTGRMNGQSAFQHLMLWHDARLRLRLESPAAERKIFVPTLRLLEDASRFSQKFEETASRVGGSRTVFRRVISRSAEIKPTIPAEIETFSHLCDGRRSLVDIVEESQFRPLDVIKIIHRLEKLGAIERVAAARPTGSPPAGDATINDWLKGGKETVLPSDRATVTEAGRRAAEMHAEEYARRADDKAPSEDVLPQTSLLQRLGAAGQQAQQKGGERRLAPPADRQNDRRTNKHNKKGKPQPQQPIAPAPAANAGKANNGARQPVVKEVDDQETRPFFKIAEEPAAGKLSSTAQRTIAGKEPVFDAVEDEFFASAEGLSKVEPVESFDDLDGAGKKPAPRWSLMSLFRPAPPVRGKSSTSPSPSSSSAPSSSSSSSSSKAPPSKPSPNAKKR